MTRIPPDEWHPVGIEELERAACEAIHQVENSVLVTAGPGAGKTEFLAQKAIFLLQTGICPVPQRILAISFKRDAARNLGARVERRSGRDLARRLDSLTFDAFTKGMLDRFRLGLPQEWRPTSDYRITFPKRDVFEDFLRRHGVTDLNATCLESLVTSYRLSPEGEHANVIEKWWKEQLERSDGSALTFDMINRLVLFLIERNPKIVRALRLTYPFVLLDEFQDTTEPQFELLRAIFQGSRSRLTAVGDDLQQIMGWAGAMPDGFARFKNTFEAQHLELEWNWRVHDKLARVQSLIARELLGRERSSKGRGKLEVEGDPVAIWVYATAADEAAGLARWLADECHKGSMGPHDVGILVRQRADRAEKQLRWAFEQHGLHLRNVARQVGEITIQDLLAEPLTEALLPVLKLAAHPRDPGAWEQVRTLLAALEALDWDDEPGHRRVVKSLQGYIRDMRKRLRDTKPSNFVGEDLFRQLLGVFGEDRLRASQPAYRRDEDFCRVREGFVRLLDESRSNAGTWHEVIDRFVGKNQIALMTIHKSKGLEFHTMIFYGLDASEWWSLRPQKPEELRAFYVALTRAKQRAIFTRAEDRGTAVSWLECILQHGDVPVRGF